MMLAAVTSKTSSKNWSPLELASAELQADREVELAAVAQNGRALRHASAELKADREVVLAAVAQDGSALQDASAELRADREVVLAAVAQNEGAMIHALPGVLLKAAATTDLEREFEAKISDRDVEIAQLKAELAQLKPAVLDLTVTDASVGEAEQQATRRTGAKRNAMVAALHTRLVEVKREKRDAEEDVEDQQQMTTDTALMLDRWQGYADELKGQLRQFGQQPRSFQEFMASRQ
jgi:hypothetical protein